MTGRTPSSPIGRPDPTKAQRTAPAADDLPMNAAVVELGPSLTQVRERLAATLPPAGQRAHRLLVMWAASLDVPPAAEELDRVITQGRVQLELRQVELDALGLVDAAQRAALECGAAQVSAALRAPYSRSLLLMALR